MSQRVLVTGGAGYIGSHTSVCLLEAGYEVHVIDNLSNSSEASLDKVREITGREIHFHRLDLLDRAGLSQAFKKIQPDAVIHFAALKSVGESNSIPLKYYQNNISATCNLLEVMVEEKVHQFVFSSSATVYGDPESVPIREDFPLHATNPYGRTKLMNEEILMDVIKAEPQMKMAILRYFNPVGAHESGELGEDPRGIPNNLLPYITQVAVGRLDRLKVFGNDYPTADGTGVRDYIHVVDLSIGHIKALEKIQNQEGLLTYNLGTGRGYSVLEMIQTFEKVSGQKINYQIIDRREGDVAECFADPSKAEKELGWKTTRDLEAMCRDAWRWQSQNPNGFE